MRLDISLDEIELLYKNKDITEREYHDLLEIYIPSVMIESNVPDPDNPNKNIKLRDYQRIVVDSPARKKALLFGRQTGKSSTIYAEMGYAGLNKFFKNKRVILFAPNKVHINNIMDDKLYKSFMGRPDTAKRILYKRNDLYYEIMFDNNTVIRGIAVNQNPVTARSHTGDVVYVDEAHYVDSEAYSALTAVTIARPHAFWVYSSTPGESSGIFYEVCNSKEFVTFYVPATLLPTWNDEQERLMRAMYPIDTVYQAEVMARFISQENSVFPSSAVDAALDKGYIELNGNKVPYDEHTWKDRFPNTGLFSIGVDWNGSANGVHIVVNMLHGTTYIEIEKVIIQSSNFVQHKAIDKIIELVDKYRPIALVVDKGYGGSQIEDLLLHGIKNPNLKIRDILMPIGFNEDVEVRDPYNGMISKRQSKTYMIMEAVRLFTEERIILMPKESDKYMLGDQLKLYRITKSLSNGSLSFRCDVQDHTLDAYCLSLYGLLNKVENILDRGNILKNVDSSKHVSVMNFSLSMDQAIDRILNSYGDINNNVDEDKLIEGITNKWFSSIKVAQRSNIDGHAGKRRDSNIYNNFNRRSRL